MNSDLTESVQASIRPGEMVDTYYYGETNLEKQAYPPALGKLAESGLMQPDELRGVGGSSFVYHGGERGNVYVITPNATNQWDLSVLATSGMPAPTPASGSGINKRFRALPTLGGFVLMPTASSNLFFLPTR